MAVSDVLAILLGTGSNASALSPIVGAAQESMAHMYDSASPFSLGTHQTKNNKKRTRKEIMTKWEQMLKFAPIAEGMGIHTTAALGGDEHTSQQVFIKPAERLQKADNPVLKAQLAKLEKRIKPMERLINQHILKLCFDACGFGDSFARVYGKKGIGVVDMMCNEYTYPPLVLPFEQGSKTLVYHLLDARNWTNTTSKLNMRQMIRMKMPRILHVPQHEIIEGMLVAKMMEEDDPDNLPLFPAHVGGSFLIAIEEIFDNVIRALAAMNTQQVADAVNQMFLTMNMAGMPPAQREAYKQGLEGMLHEHEQFVKNTLDSGDALYTTKYHVLPTWDEKQILNPIGDIKGQRSTAINIETFMIDVRLLMGGLGLDPSMVGWADMLSGGLGDGSASLTYSSQVMRRSMMIRQAAAQMANNLLKIDWGYAYNEDFDNELDYPWQVVFHSDQTAAANEIQTTKQTRMNTLLIKTQVISAIKDAGLNEENTAMLLERDGGMDYDEAQNLAKDITSARENALEDANNPNGNPQDDNLNPDPSTDDEEDGI